MAQYGRSWTQIAEKMPTRNEPQVRSHAQKYFMRKATQEKQRQAAANAAKQGPQVRLAAPRQHHDDHYRCGDPGDFIVGLDSREGRVIVEPRTRKKRTITRSTQPIVQQILQQNLTARVAFEPVASVPVDWPKNPSFDRTRLPTALGHLANTAISNFGSPTTPTTIPTTPTTDALATAVSNASS
mmetsp:Transcript_28227/g.90980  ORF Transcript_28227/g.90980 Transcript_28227/m.90980 type:complete len:184 (-) Transcript_28227:305-856(-)